MSPKKYVPLKGGGGPRAEYVRLQEAIGEFDRCRACICENRGPAKEEAREALEAHVAEELMPALVAALEMAEETSTRVGWRGSR